MPTYEYVCDKCGKGFTVVEAMRAHGGRAPACPRCRSRSTRRVLAAFYAKTIKKS